MLSNRMERATVAAPAADGSGGGRRAGRLPVHADPGGRAAARRWRRWPRPGAAPTSGAFGWLR